MFVYLLLERGGGIKVNRCQRLLLTYLEGEKKDSVAYNIRNYNLIFIDRIEMPFIPLHRCLSVILTYSTGANPTPVCIWKIKGLEVG